MISEGLSLFVGVNPEDTYNETPYEKGFCFVSYLAHLVGDQSKFDGFLQVGANRYLVEIPSQTHPMVGGWSVTGPWEGLDRWLGTGGGDGQWRCPWEDEAGTELAAGSDNALRCPRGRRGLGSPWGRMGLVWAQQR